MTMLKHPSLLDNFTSGVAAKNIIHQNPLIRANERTYELRRMKSLPTYDLINSLYPRLISLHNLINDSNEYNNNESNQRKHLKESNYGELFNEFENFQTLKLPKSLPVTSEVFESDGIYLLDDGSSLWLYIGRNVTPDLLNEWFNLPLNSFEKPNFISFNMNSSEGNLMNNIVSYLRQHNWNQQG